MKRIIIFATLVAAFGTVVSAQTRWPDVKVENTRGETVGTRSLLEEKLPTVVLFWSTTCKPCLMELNAVSDLYEEWQEEVKFRVLAVSTDDSRASSKAMALAKGSNWPFTVLLDKNQDLKRAMNVNVMPQMFILDRDGNIVHSHTGYTPGSEYDILDRLKAIK